MDPKALHEWVVTLHRKEDLESFYDDMETPGGNLFIPNRAVDVANKRPISRNTHYMLTYDEAELVKNDDRVWDVTLHDLMILATPKPLGYKIENKDFSKSNTTNAGHTQWGFVTHSDDTLRSTWSSTSTTSLTGVDLTITASGKNVDVLIVDGHIDPDHPEFARFADGGGGSRVQQINWFDYGGSGTYVYTPYSQVSDPPGGGLSGDNNHGAHCAGTVAGNTQGWARDSDIYNISPYGSNPNGNISTTMWDYIRAWHNSKPINTDTGRRNPTISNHSYGSSLTHIRGGYGSIAFPYEITYRGTTVSVPSNQELTTAQLEARGINCYQTSVDTDGDGIADTVVDACDTQYYDTARFADIQDAIDDGIIICYAAGNENALITKAGDVDYDNRHKWLYLNLFTYDLPYHRGSSSGQGVDNTIVVGCVDNYMQGNDHRKTSYSNWGSAVDIFAAGDYIQSAVNDTTKVSTGLSTAADSRGGTNPLGVAYGQSKYPGTSMASPQVTGVLALLAETWQGMTQADAQAWVRENALVDKLYESGTIDPTQLYNLGTADNLMLFWKNQRKESGSTYPLKTAGRREKSSIKYPRPRIRRRG